MLSHMAISLGGADVSSGRRGSGHSGVREVVECLDGTIAIYSVEGEGTTLRLRLRIETDG
jgi:signal transduction histidine kinase